MDTEHPTECILKGICSRCQYAFDWRLLEPLVNLHQRIRLLCPSCRMEVEPTCKEA